MLGEVGEPKGAKRGGGSFFLLFDAAINQKVDSKFISIGKQEKKIVVN